MDLKKCDMCGKEIKYRSDQGDYENIAGWITIKGYDIRDKSLDLCEYCFNALMDFIQYKNPIYTTLVKASEEKAKAKDIEPVEPPLKWWQRLKKQRPNCERKTL